MPDAHTRDLDGKVALVTGGSSGIGKAIAVVLAGAGCKVAIAGRRQAVLDSALDEIREHGAGAAFRGDVSTASEAAGLVEQTLDAFGALHVLVNNAGVARGGALEDMTDEDIDITVEVDVKGPIWITRAALPHLAAHRDADGAAIINISSSVTFGAVADFSVYSGAKAAVEMLTRCWALDFADRRIRVNAISPGIVETPIFETMMSTDQIAPALAHFDEATPLGRVGQPEDIARLALFLAGPDSGWMTGAVIPLDGGLSLVRG